MPASTYVAVANAILIAQSRGMQTGDLHLFVGIAETAVVLNAANAWPGFIADCHAAACAAVDAGQPWQSAVRAMIDRAVVLLSRG